MRTTAGIPSDHVEDLEADTIEGRDGFKLIRPQLEVMNPPLIQNATGSWSSGMTSPSHGEGRRFESG